LVLVEEPRRLGLAHALNLGYETAIGEIVVKSDCDILLEENAIRAIVSRFVDPRVGGVSGKQLLLKHVRIEDGYRRMFDSKRTLESQFGAVYQFEPFCAFRKSLMVAIDESSVADDAEVAIGILRKGYATVFEPTARFFEDTPRALRKRLAQKQRRAQGHIQLAIQNRDMLFNRKFGFFGMVVFPITFAMIVLNPWLILAMIGFTSVALSLNYGFCGIILIAIGLGATISIYTTGTPPLLAGLLESQLALIIGWLRLTVRGPEHIWAKAH
jgi:cellulose synthase/poly-beta-1,6-N-acetylglucosamine synthase-like glycosyltransferase